jgi:hypothetical protein
VARRIGPTGKRQSRRFGCFLFRIGVAEKARTRLGVLLLGFGVSGAAVFAEPTVTEIEKVVCLIQENRDQRSEVRDQKSEVRSGHLVADL